MFLRGEYNSLRFLFCIYSDKPDSDLFFGWTTLTGYTNRKSNSYFGSKVSLIMKSLTWPVKNGFHVHISPMEWNAGKRLACFRVLLLVEAVITCWCAFSDW